jgi:hypothetical protein
MLLLTARCATAVPYEEDDRDNSIWFLDHSYLESMFQMFKKVNGELAHLGKVRCFLLLLALLN